LITLSAIIISGLHCIKGIPTTNLFLQNSQPSIQFDMFMITYVSWPPSTKKSLQPYKWIRHHYNTPSHTELSVKLFSVHKTNTNICHTDLAKNDVLVFHNSQGASNFRKVKIPLLLPWTWKQQVPHHNKLPINVASCPPNIHQQHQTTYYNQFSWLNSTVLYTFP
jgi:hypothetical protein